jgi:hypothetical protein
MSGGDVYADSVTSYYGTIGGGAANVADRYATVGGGISNRAIESWTTIAGGESNTASGMWATVAGGRSNRSRSQYAAIGGGFGNIVAGEQATIPGGSVNAARGDYSFAAGLSARANHDNAFVWNGPASSVDSLVSTGTGQFLIGAPGGVGVNTDTPATSLHVASSDRGLNAANMGNDDIVIEGSDSVIGLYSTSGGNWGSAVSLAELATVEDIGILVNKWAMARNTSSAGDHLRFTFGTNADYAQNDTQVRFETDGDVFADGTFTPGGADLAEAFDVAGEMETYQPGDVLVISESADRQMERSRSAYSTLVAGVYATKPGVLLSDLGVDDDRSQKVPLAVVGVVPTKVTAEGGGIRRGDLLVTSSTEGHAMKADATMLGFGMVMGKALENFDGPGKGLIQVLVNVK